MKTILVALNAKYAHTSLAIRSIAACAGKSGRTGVEIAEFTVNQRANDILAALYGLDGDVYIFSCYIWSIELIKRIAAELLKILPGALVGAGGPEAANRSRDFLCENPQFHFAVRGEGESSTVGIIKALQNGEGLSGCPGAVWRDGTAVVENSPAAAPDLDALPFPYTDLGALRDRAVYYESMRGCPFRCAYCISSIEPGVRFRALPLVFADLQFFLRAQVRRVKFVDRTFNCDRGRALKIWRFLQAHDNGVTNFHFELSGDLLDKASIEFLAAVRPGLFQFEIGVQSTNGETLAAVDRGADMEKLLGAVHSLSQARNIHLHLDLIAGLPYEDLTRFKQSFNEVYALRPARLQLGFLKVLRGSPMEARAQEHGIVYQDRAPYEVLSTRWIGYASLRHLKDVEHLLELYYNSGRFSHIVEHLLHYFDTPFDFFEALAGCFRERGCFERPPDRTGQYALLGDLMRAHGIPADERAQACCVFDLLLHDRLKKRPEWVKLDTPPEYRRACRAYLARHGLARRAELFYFPLSPLPGGGGPVVLLFDYGNRDICGHAQIRALEGVTKEVE